MVPEGIPLDFSNQDSVDKFISAVQEPENESDYTYGIYASRMNIFRKLGVYSSAQGPSYLNYYSLKYSPYYCGEADMLNIIYPESVFEEYNIVNLMSYHKNIILT